MNLYAVVHGEQWSLTTSRERAMRKALDTGANVIYKRSVLAGERVGWDQITFCKGAEVIYVPRQFADPLRTVRLAPYLSGMGPTFTLIMGATNRTDYRGQTTIEYELRAHEHGRTSIIFSGADFHGSPQHGDDSDATVAALLSHLSLKPGDTDSEHFDGYTPAQLEFANTHGEYLAFASINRFGEH